MSHSLPEFIQSFSKNCKKTIQTHISYVILFDDYTYKIKKDKALPFLDFSSPEQRLHYCKEEIRLNKRMAEELYIGVIGIDAQGNIVSSEDKKAIDYAVKMKTFDQRSLFTNLLAEGLLTKEDIISLGRQLADFHLHKTATGPEISDYGKPQHIKQIYDNNLALMKQFTGTTLAEELDHFFTDYFDQHMHLQEETYQKRMDEGKVRECHGDMHLENICKFNDRTTVFDCIEFNKDFRYIDVFYDLAFLYMDLCFRRERPLANLVLSTYLEITNDFHGMKLFNAYNAMRAIIRGNVTSLQLDDPGVTAAQKKEAKTKATAFYSLAEEFCKPTPGKITCMRGLSGSGKSTVAQEVAMAHNAIILRSDAIRKHLFNIPLNEHRDDIYTDEHSRQTFRHIASIASQLMSSGFHVIIDSTLLKQWQQELFYDLSQSHKTDFHILECTAPDDEIRKRLRERKGNVSDADEKVYDLQLNTQDPVLPSLKQHTINIDTTQQTNLAQLNL